MSHNTNQVAITSMCTTCSVFVVLLLTSVFASVCGLQLNCFGDIVRSNSRVIGERIRLLPAASAPHPGTMKTEEDEIIEEIPLYLSKNLADKLYVLQYPTKRHNDNNDVVARASVKPLNQEISIDYALDTASRHYDAFKGEQLAITADGKDGRTDKATFSSGTMDRQTYVGTKSVDNCSRYVVGYLNECHERGKEIHLSIVKSLLQMRPSFAHFDKADTRKKAEQKTEQESDTEEEEPKQVTVKFARTETDRTRKAREKSFNYLSKRSAEEAWCEASWHGRHSMQAQLERQKMFCGTDETTGHTLSLSNAEYLEALIPAERDYSNGDEAVPMHIASLGKLKTLPLNDQLKQILVNAKMVSFERITQLIDVRIYDEEKILRTLPTIGHMLHGNWVAQSEVIYPPKSVSAINGVPADLMCRARDYILYQFYRHEAIDRKRIGHIAQVPADEVKQLLEGVSSFCRKYGWQLLRPPDVNFETEHPELKQRQDLFWKSKDDSFVDLEQDAKSPRRKRKISIKSEPK